jgi:hypothetical protein
MLAFPLLFVILIISVRGTISTTPFLYLNDCRNGAQIREYNFALASENGDPDPFSLLEAEDNKESNHLPIPYRILPFQSPRPISRCIHALQSKLIAKVISILATPTYYDAKNNIWNSVARNLSLSRTFRDETIRKRILCI